MRSRVARDVTDILQSQSGRAIRLMIIINTTQKIGKLGVW